MIKRWIITGDTHGRVSDRIDKIVHNMNDLVVEETAVIILGDAGLNYYLNKTDLKQKRLSSSFGIRIYCVRGNHEQRPQNVQGMKLVYDEDVAGEVYIEDDLPLIRYFVDGGEYTIDGRSVLVIGGAYSVDKYYRLARAAGRSFSGWFEDEQLTEAEQDEILLRVHGKHYDFVLTHTAPITWEPTDLFLSCIDQSMVDKSTEEWLRDVACSISWGHWLFGHYHADRIEYPHVEQFFNEYEDMNTIVERWKKFDETGHLDWWLPKSPRFNN